MRTKTFIKFVNITSLIKFKNIYKKYKRKTNIQIKIYFKCLFTSIFQILMNFFLYTNKSYNTSLKQSYAKNKD